MSFLVGKPNRLFPTSLSSFLLGSREKSKKKIMIFLFRLVLTMSPVETEISQLGFQDAATPIGIIDNHHDLKSFCVSSFLTVWNWSFFYFPNKILYGTTIEILRTIFPSIILLLICLSPDVAHCAGAGEGPQLSRITILAFPFLV